MICECAAGQRFTAEQSQRAARLAWEQAGIPRRFHAATLESSPWAGRRPGLIESLRESAGSWYFFGPVGTGKTGLAVGYARTWVFGDTLGDVRFRSVPDLLTELRDTYSRRENGRTEMDILNDCRDADLLVLDDLGAEQVTNSGWLEDRLYQIIGHRHGDDSATVFTSNLSLEQLANRIGDRITWRIAEMCNGHIVHLAGPNLRAQAQA